MANKGSGTGKGGKSFQDRELAARVRTLTLTNCESFESRKGKLYEAVLLRLAGTVLPRLTEVSGEDGKPIAVTLVKYGGKATA